MVFFCNFLHLIPSMPFVFAFLLFARTCPAGPLYESFSVTGFIVSVGMRLIHNSLQEDSAAILVLSTAKYSETSVFPFFLANFRQENSEDFLRIEELTVEEFLIPLPPRL